MRLILLLALSASLLAQTPTARYYGAIDLGSKGVKAYLYSFEREGKARDAKVLYRNTINTKLVATAKDGKFSADGMAEATDAAKTLVGELKTQAAAHQLAQVEYYVVLSSGVTAFSNASDLETSVKDATGVSVTTIDAREEGYYGFLSAVPRSDRTTSIMIDEGSGNTKLSCMANGKVQAAEVPFGTVTLRTEAMKLGGDYEASIATVIQQKVKPAIEKALTMAPCLATERRSIAWIGGAAWATATFSHPEMVHWGYVKVSPEELASFRQRALNGHYLDEPRFYFAASITEPQRAEIKSTAAKDRKSVEDTFSREDLYSGASLMQALASSIHISGSMIFARNGNYLFGYALERYHEDQEEAEVQESIPEGSKFVALIDLGPKSATSYLYAFPPQSGRMLDPMVAFQVETPYNPGIAPAVEAVRTSVSGLQQQMQTLGLDPRIHILANPGLTTSKNYEDLRTAVNTAVGIPVETLDARRESGYIVLAGIPAKYRENAFIADMGDSEVKLGCSVRGRTQFAKIDFGTARLVSRSRQPGVSFQRSLDQTLEKQVRTAYWQESANTPCLQSRGYVYWTGDAAWAAATLLYPAKSSEGWVEIDRAKLEALKQQVANRSIYREQPAFEFAANVNPKMRESIKAANLRDREIILTKRFRDPDELTAGLSLMEMILSYNPLGKLYYARNGFYVSGYAAEKYANGEVAPLLNAQPAQVSAAR
jgi:exopolyphosphatase/pppGpp-phosphohydrolase